MINLLLAIPSIGVFIMYIKKRNNTIATNDVDAESHCTNKQYKTIALQISVYTLLFSLFIFALFDFSKNQFQYVSEYPQKAFFNLLQYHDISSFNLHLGLDGLSIYFILLTTILMPVSLLSNWTSIADKPKTYLITILLTETLLLLVFLVLDSFLFYIFFESILPPLFMLIGSFGSSNKVRASLYLFLYTLAGSLFLLLSIVSMNSITGFTDFDAICKIYFTYNTQLYLFYGIFIAFAVKTPIIMLNSWLVKAHVESPLSGSIILAGIVLKLSLYGILRLILPLLPKAYIHSTFILYLIGIISILYASVSTLRTIDVKELIAYSSVSHAAVYLLGVFSNTIQGIEGAISLGLAHGFVSSGLFICAGGVLYDRSSTRLITYYRGIAQIMPIFSVILFILCLANCGVPLTFNFVGEFLSLYGSFERSPVLGVLASSSIIFSAAYSIYMFNRIAFAGSYSKYFSVNMPDINKRELYILLVLALFTVALGVYPAPVLDGLHYSVTTMIYCVPKLYFITNSKKFFDCLKGVPKAHAFVNLPIQSELSSTLIPSYTAFSTMLGVICNSNSNPNPIILCVLLLVWGLSIILLCTEQGSSSNQAHEQVHDHTVRVPRPAIENRPVANITYVSVLSPVTNQVKRVLVDLNDSTGFRLTQLWPLTSYKPKSVMVENTMRVGIMLPEPRKQDNVCRHPEVQGPGQHTGIWVSSMMDPSHPNINIRVVTRGSPVITESILACTLTTVGTGSGQTMKSFIRK